MSDELHFKPIHEVAPLIEAGSLSALELTETLLVRIEARDSDLHTYATVMAEQAIADARQADEDFANGHYRGPLHGIPVAVKDLCNTVGVPTMGGCEVLRDHVPDFDATVVTRLRAAGAIILGKLNLTEGAMAGYNPAFPVPENPWKPGHWSGASSSGSGAATAAGLAYATLGSDTGGSIRHPAAACGTVGLKPTWGRVSRYGVLDLAQSLDHVGPLTRSSADAGFVHNAIAGYDPADPTTLVNRELTAGKRLSDTQSRPLQGLKVGWDAHYSADGVAPDFADSVASAVEVLGSLGADVVEVRMPEQLREYLPAWQVLCCSEAAHAHRETYPSRAADYGPWFAEWLRRGNAYSSIDYADAHLQRLSCNGDLAVTMRDIDVLACPTTLREAYPVSPEISYGPIPVDRDPWDSRFTVPTDYAGLPTLALPCGLSEKQMPLSFQLVGHALSEDLLISIGQAFEAATTWHRMHPPNS